MIEYDKRYLQEATYFPQNGTYQINGFTFGLISDLWDILGNHLNFSSVLFKDKEKFWGNAIKLENGTIITTGITDDLFRKKVEVAVAPITLTSLRMQFITYLPPVNVDMIGIAIPNSAISESFDFPLFFKPLSIYLWIVIAITIVLISIFKSMADRNRNLYVWSSFMTMFGGAPNEDNLEKGSMKIVVFVSLITGVVIWNSYNASFTSELASIKEKYPFEDLESLAMSNWR